MLGLTWDFGDEEYSVVWRDNSAIHLARGDAHPPAGLHVFQWVRDVDAYHREIRERGADVVEDPTGRPYPIRELKVRDPNGVEIVFGQDID